MSERAWETWEDATKRELVELAQKYTNGEKTPGRLNKLCQNAAEQGWNIGIKLKEDSSTEYEIFMEKMNISTSQK